MADDSKSPYPHEVCISIPGGGVTLPAKRILSSLDGVPGQRVRSWELGGAAIARLSGDESFIEGYASPKDEKPIWAVPLSVLRNAAQMYRAPAVFTPKTHLSPAEFVLMDGKLLHLGVDPDELPSSIVVLGDPKRTHDLAREVGLNVRYETKADADHRRLPCVIGDLPGSNLPVAFVTHQLGVGAAEICLAEIFRAAHYDSNRRLREKPRPTVVVRFGTCGIADPRIPLGRPILSTCSVGCDWTGLFTRSATVADSDSSGDAVRKVREAFLESLPANHPLMSGLSLYGATPDPQLVSLAKQIAHEMGIPLDTGVTFNAAGFFETQGRPGSDDTAVESLIKTLFRAGVTNIEMESSIVLKQTQMWRGRAVVIAVGVADRTRDVFATSSEYLEGHRNSVKLVTTLLERAARLSAD